MKEIQPVVKVTKKLWGKLTPEQKKIWNQSYRENLLELNQLSSVHNPIKAYNLAFLEAWRGK